MHLYQSFSMATLLGNIYLETTNAKHENDPKLHIHTYVASEYKHLWVL